MHKIQRLTLDQIRQFVEGSRTIGLTKHMREADYEFIERKLIFFFQAEDGIRDTSVTGVQTCALPILHEDHKAPIVAVNLWYHVGSKNERPGRTGFAHLFEHLMFNGSEHFNDDYFQPFERIGATDQNGTTNEDRTNYFENVPTTALDIALWMESDRMGHLLGVIDTARVNEQRGVVQNEKRQGENQPYGKVDILMPEATYPAGHPYSWSVIGSMEDLDAAKVDDVKEWFRTYYGPNNAVIVLAGDITPETARQKVEQYFGDIPATPSIAKH